MKIKQLHNWNVTIDEAKAIQLELKQKIHLQKLMTEVRLVSGADVSYSKKAEMCFASVIVFKYPAMEVIEQKNSTGTVNLPYVPGYLTFREAPILLSAFERVENVPDLVLFDGQGIAHPLNMGLAAHVGLILDLPSIGCAKNLLIGDYEEPASIKGNWSKLIYQNQQMGAVVRTRDEVKPVFVSPGFKVTIDEAVDWVLKTCAGYRIPEPIRQSHLAVNRLRTNYEERFF
ncbi:MAG: deoxyribonuclease V [bacterium]|nr:MAG: deoxyribonuclease V [bacterium]